jgi:CubicO group peptidase (beta-lactamase class C family)
MSRKFTSEFEVVQRQAGASGYPSSIDQVGSHPFPSASPGSMGMSLEGLRHAVETAQRYVEDRRIVGATMLVIRRGRIVLHDSVGWSDRERNIPMNIDSIFDQQSLTKPLVSTAILMLKEEGRLSLEDMASKYLPAFDNERSGAITIQQLLTHTAGFPYQFPWNQFASLREVVDDAGQRGPDTAPGTRFEYSSGGSGVLTAIVAEVSGMTGEDFIRARILEPLGMGDSFLEFDRLQSDDPRIARVTARYDGATGSWKKGWDSTQPSTTRYFTGGWGLYASAIDYAKFLSMALHDGRFCDRRFLSEESLRIATSPSSLEKYYGLCWEVPADTIFGHAGIYGTYAWVDREHDLVGLYLTQSTTPGNDTLGRTDANLLWNPEFKKLVEKAILR